MLYLVNLTVRKIIYNRDEDLKGQGSSKFFYNYSNLYLKSVERTEKTCQMTTVQAVTNLQRRLAKLQYSVRLH